MDVGGLFFDLEAVRTTLTEMLRAGSPWHHSFPPFDVELLSRLHGSKQKLRDKVLAMTRVPSTFDHGGA